ncbi:MAG: UDP-2,3-diacylglucosamine diphosphatase LpxI [Pseudolabrys sp.]|nr:UDP-2,3-diacylglucosamine diphosphatase LpxI [Pseudolabrys sp.]
MSQDNAAPLAIVCSGGSLPFAVADAAIAQGRRVILFAVRGIADAGRVAHYPHKWFSLGQFGRLMSAMRKAGCRDMVMVGSLARPPMFSVRFDLTTLRLFPRLFRMYRGGDNHLLSELGRIFEDHGFRMLGAHEIAPELLMPEGDLTRRRPSQSDRADIDRGFEVLTAIGAYDVGQAAVVANGQVLAIESVGGTDQLLDHVAQLRAEGRLSTPVGLGVLVKAPKPAQDHRYDLPTIGPKTVEGVANAGLAGIAVAAGEALAADLVRAVELADAKNIFIVGLKR